MTLLTIGGHSHAAPYDYVSGMADRHYATPLMLVSLATSPLAGPTSWPLLAILAAYAANTKNEAAVYVLILCLAWSTHIAIRRTFDVTAARRELPALAFAVLLGFIPLVAWRVYSASHMIPGGLALDEQVGSLATRIAERLPTVAEHLLFRLHQAGATWMAIALTTLAGIGSLKARQRILSPHELSVVAASITVCALICLVFVLTPHDYVLHMNMAMARLAVLPTLLLGAAAVVRLARLVRTP
jgi:hypothetical protein